MNNQKDSSLIPSPPSFESLKKLNDHGIEYWSARDLPPCLGYTQWRRFENAIKKAMESCKQSGNDPSHHFAGAGKQIEFGKGAMQTVESCCPMRYLKKEQK